jgi:hypothetical protein
LRAIAVGTGAGEACAKPEPRMRFVARPQPAITSATMQPTTTKRSHCSFITFVKFTLRKNAEMALRLPPS